MAYRSDFLVHRVYFVLSRSAARGTGGEGGVNVKLLAEQNMQLKEGLKRLHTRSIAEKTDVGTLFKALVIHVKSPFTPAVRARISV